MEWFQNLFNELLEHSKIKLYGVNDKENHDRQEGHSRVSIKLFFYLVLNTFTFLEVFPLEFFHGENICEMCMDVILPSRCADCSSP